MTAPLITRLRTLGVSDDRIAEESFASPSRESSIVVTDRFDAAAAAGATLEFARSGRRIANLGGRTILEIAEANGIALPYDCRSAVCGQCKIAVRSGLALMDAADALTAADHANGIVLACQARCQNHVVVDA